MGIELNTMNLFCPPMLKMDQFNTEEVLTYMMYIDCLSCLASAPYGQKAALLLQTVGFVPGVGGHGVELIDSSSSSVEKDRIAVPNIVVGSLL
jgi:hypothetical protein